MSVIKYCVYGQGLLCVIALAFYFITALPEPSVQRNFSALVFAHRGYYEKAPENSLAAIQAAYDIGANAVEIDVMQSKDLVPVVIHDQDIRHTTLNEGLVSNLSADQLLAIPLKDRQTGAASTWHIPSLESAIKLAKNLNITLEIELKTEIHNHFAMAKAIQALFLKYDFYEQGFVSSFDPRLLYYVRSIEPNITTALGLLSHPPYSFVLNYIFQQPFFMDYLGVSIVEPEYTLATDPFIEYWQGQNKQINVWVINSQKKKQYLLQKGVSVTSDCILGSC
ncbi:glycerophosphodiester phosphodiesterase [Oceaniserpentilla sp. 4NH20-0058]|uniref:glycerophosphodiester phosphodiesterase n=1 Tax=Oceaniserpentilla sp. 4NH20-0058 TaxID=3127660 RepID=UPI003105993E